MDQKGKVSQVTPSDQYDSWAPAPAPNGYLYFTSNRNGKAAIFDMDQKGKVSQVTPSDQYDSWAPAPAPNGYLYFTSNRNNKAAIFYMDQKGKVSQVTPSNQYDSWGLSWKDGRGLFLKKPQTIPRRTAWLKWNE
jgi:Tol biopolymer transport system component